MKRLSVVVGLLCALLMPVCAFASPIETFTDGFQDLVQPERETDELKVQPEREFQDEYVPEVRPVRLQEVEEGDTNGFIQSVVDAWQQIPGNVGSISLLNFLKWMLGAQGNNSIGSIVMIAAVSMVFMWWGVRKAVRMIMAAWRSGRQTA